MIQKPKGTKDILPQDSYKWQYIEQKTKELFENYGFKEIRVPVFENTAVDEKRTLYWEHEGGKAVREGDWKLVALRNSGWQLFNLANDLSETNNLAIENPDIVKYLKSKWNAWAINVGLSVPIEVPDTETNMKFHYATKN